MAYDFAKASVTKSEILKDETLLLIAYNNLSEIYYYKRQYKKAYEYAGKAEILALKQHDYKIQAILYSRLGKIEKRNNEYSTALANYQKALIIAEKYNLDEVQSAIYSSLSMLYNAKNEKKEAFKQIKKAIAIAKKANLKESLLLNYNRLGVLQYSTQNDSALFSYNKALQFAKELGNKYIQCIALANLGDVYLDRGAYASALKSLEQSKTLANEVGEKETLHFINLSLGVYYEEIEDYKTAALKYEEALKYKPYVDGFQQKIAYWLLSGAYEHSNDYKKAYAAQEKYIALNDSLLTVEKAKAFDKIRTTYEVEKKNDKIKLLEKENEITETKRKWTIISAILIAIPLVLLFLFYRQRAKNQERISHQEKKRLAQEQELVKVNALIKGQDEERHRIAKELHDGIGGQLAGVNFSLSHLNVILKNEKINAVNESLTHVFNELRSLSHTLSSNYHKDKSLETLLAELKKQYELQGVFKIELSVFPAHVFKDLDIKIKHHLYRITQELLTNSAKYSKAELVQITFNLHDTLLIMMYEDNGKGFDVKNTKAGIGLKNIEERVESLNGSLIIESIPSKGVQMILEVLLKNENN